MAHYKMSDIAIEVSRRENNPKQSKYEKFVGLEHYMSGEVLIRNFGSTERLESSMKVFQSGDILVARRNVYLKRAAAVDFDGLTSGDSIVLRAKNQMFGRILPFVLNTDEFWDFAERYSDGTMSKRLSPKTLLSYEFDLPNEEQLAGFTETLWTIDKTREAYKKLIKMTDELVKCRFTEMFGNLENNRYSAPLEEAFSIRDDLRKPINDAVRSGMHTGTLYPYYGANGQVDSINDYLMDGEALCIAEDCGCYGAGEATSYIVSGKCWVNNHAHVLFPRECCNIWFANVYFRILDLREYVTGTTRLKLTQGKLKEIPMLLPPIELQNEFAEFVKQSDKAKSELEQALTELTATYKRIISENLG